MIFPFVLYLSLQALGSNPKDKVDQVSPCSRLMVDPDALVWISSEGVVSETAAKLSGRDSEKLRPLLKVLRQLPFRNDIVKEIPELRKLEWNGLKGYAYAEFRTKENGVVILTISDLGLMEIKIGPTGVSEDHNLYEDIVYALSSAGAHALVTPYFVIDPPNTDELPGLCIKRLDMNDANTRAGVRQLLKIVQ